MTLNDEALEKARAAIVYLSHPETPWSNEQVGAVITAYLSALPSPDVAGVEPVAWLGEYADGEPMTCYRREVAEAWNGDPLEPVYSLASITRLSAEKDEAEAEVAALTSNIESLLKIIETWKALANEAEARADALQRELDQANRTIEFVQSWAWRESSKLSDSERLSAIQYHPAIHARSVIEGDGT